MRDTISFGLGTTVWAVSAVLSLRVAGEAFAADPSEGSAGKDVADMDISELVDVRVTPFDVSASLDSGYRASNAVSASRFDAPIRDLPFAIQAFTETFIRDQKPVTLFDVARYSPGVTYRSNDFNEGNANVSIRGFAVGSLAGGNIHVLRDGFHGPSIFDFTNISRVEVVKGPSSFLYGQVAPGGVVNVITKGPKSTFAASADARYGAFGQYRLEGDVTGPAVSSVFYRLAGSYDHDIDYWKPYDGRSWDLAPSLLWQPTDRLSISLRYEHFLKNETPQVMQKPGYDAQAGVVPTPGDPNLSGVDVPGLPNDWNSMSYSDYRRSTFDDLSTWVDLAVDDHWNLRASFAHLTYETDMLFTGNFGMANNTTVLQGRRVRHQVYTNRDDSFELQGVGKYEFEVMSLHLLLGALYVDRGFHVWAGQAPNDPALGSDPIASPLPLWNLEDPSTWDRHATVPSSRLTANIVDNDVGYTDKSAYAGSTFGFFDDRLFVLAGARLTSTDRDFSNRATGQPQPHATSTRLTPQVGLLYKVLPEVYAYGSYAESFVPGTYIIAHPDGTVSPAEPTEGRGYDVGVKLALFDGRLSSTLTFFDLRNRRVVTDLAVTSASGIVTIYNVQDGEQRSYGLEWDGTLTLTPGWQVYLSYSYMHARILEVTGNDAAILAQDPATLDAAGRANYRNVRRFHGAPLQMSAPHLANLWTRYDFTNGALRGLFAAGGVNLVYDQTILPDGPESAHQTYALITAMVGYGLELGGYPVKLDVTGKNLADTYYRPSQSTRCRPREVMLDLSAKF